MMPNCDPIWTFWASCAPTDGRGGPRPQVPWDSNCFLAWLMQEAERVDALRRVLDQADGGRLQIVTSTLTPAEVLLLRGAPGSVPTSAIGCARSSGDRASSCCRSTGPRENWPRISCGITTFSRRTVCIWQRRLRPAWSYSRPATGNSCGSRNCTYTDGNGSSGNPLSIRWNSTCDRAGRSVLHDGGRGGYVHGVSA